MARNGGSDVEKRTPALFGKRSCVSNEDAVQEFSGRRSPKSNMIDSLLSIEELERKRLVRKAYYNKNRELILQKKHARWPTIAAAKKIYSREYRKRHLSEYAERDRIYRETHPKEIKIRNLRYAKNNRDKANQWSKKWLSKNPGKRKLYENRYRNRFPERIRAKQSKRYAIQLGATVGDPKQIVELIFSVKTSKDAACSYCGSPLFGNPVHFDHIIPLSRGGAHCVENLCATCPKCNVSKLAKLVSEWRPELSEKFPGKLNPMVLSLI